MLCPEMTSHSDASPGLHTHAKFAVQYKQRPLKALEDRTLILTSYCFHAQYIQGVPPKTIVKTEFTIPFIEISALENVNAEEISFSLTDQRHLTYVASSADVLAIMSHIMMSVTNHFPEIDVEERLIALKVSDTDRLATIRNAMQTRRARIEGSPCGSFRETYDYFCKYFNSPKRDEIVWDIETVYHTQNNKTLTLRDFDHVDSKDLLPIIATTSFSGWFNALDASGIRLTLEAQTQVLNVLKRNKQLWNLVLDNCFLKSEFFSKMPAFVESSGCGLRHLDLSNNPIGDAGIVALSGLFTKLRLSLERLVLANCSMSARGANRLAEAFAGSIRDLKAPLAELNLSGNSLKGEELSQFFNFLANQNSLTVVDLSKTDCSIDSLSVSLSRGCTQHLRVLRLSNNPFFTSRKSAIVNDAWRQFFSTTIALEEVYLASCRLPLEALRQLFAGLATNNALSGLTLDLSSNELRTGGAADVLLGSLSKVPMLCSLDLSDNELNIDMLKVIDALSSSHHVKHLKIGANYGALKARQIIEVMEKLTHLIQSPASSIESLSLADSKLRGDITILLNELSSNPHLVTLDISGNLMGDVGLRILSRILVLNTHLRELAWDRNCLSLQSLEEVAKALEHNHTLQFLRLPTCDLGPLMQRNPERTTALIAKIEAALAKNHGLRKMNTDRAFKLHQGFASSSSHQLIDKLIVQLDSRSSRLLTAKPEDLSDEAKEAVAEARAIVNDAQAAKRLLASLQADRLSQEEDRDTPVALSLNRVPPKLQTAMAEQIRLSVERMIDVAKTQCSFVARDEALCSSLMSECLAKCQLAPRFLDSLVQCTLSTGLANKVSELDLSSASHISDRILDETIRHLDRQHRTVHHHRAAFAANVVTLRRRRKLAAESVSSIGSNSPFDESEEDNVLPELETIEKNASARVCRPRSTFAIPEAAVSENEEEELDELIRKEANKLAVTDVKDDAKAEPKELKESKTESKEAKEEVMEEPKKELKEAPKAEVKEVKEHVEEEPKKEVKGELKDEVKAEMKEEVKSEPKEEAKEKRRSVKARAPSPPTTAPPPLSAIPPPSLGGEEEGRKERTATLPSLPTIAPPSVSPKRRPHSLQDDKAVEAASDLGRKAESRSSTASGSTSVEDLLADTPSRHPSSSARPPSTTSQSGASRSQDSLDSIGPLSPFSETPSAGASPSLGHRPLNHPARSRPKRPRQHRPTKTNATGDGSFDNLFPATGPQPASEEEEEEPAGEKKESVAKSSPEGPAADKNTKRSFMKNVLKHIPSKDKPKKSPAKEPEPEAKLEPPPVEAPEEPPTSAAAPASGPTRFKPRNVLPMPAVSLADIKKRREDLRSGVDTPPAGPKPPSPKPAHTSPRSSIAQWIEQGKPDTPASPKPKPSFDVPTLRPTALREKEPKSAAQLDADKEKRLSVRERVANFAPNASPPAPPPKPRKPSNLRNSLESGKPTPPEKPQE